MKNHKPQPHPQAPDVFYCESCGQKARELIGECNPTNRSEFLVKRILSKNTIAQRYFIFNDQKPLNHYFRKYPKRLN